MATKPQDLVNLLGAMCAYCL